MGGVASVIISSLFLYFAFLAGEEGVIFVGKHVLHILSKIGERRREILFVYGLVLSLLEGTVELFRFVWFS